MIINSTTLSRDEELTIVQYSHLVVHFLLVDRFTEMDGQNLDAEVASVDLPVSEFLMFQIRSCHEGDDEYWLGELLAPHSQKTRSHRFQCK